MPHLPRRALLGAATAAALAGSARAQGFPSRPLRIIVPFAAGGGIDAVARILAQKLSPLLGQGVVVENRTGAGGAVGVEAMATSSPDGHTLAILSPGTTTIGPAIRTSPYDPMALGMVARVTASPLMLVCRNSLPARNLQEFVALLRAQPDAIRMASAGVGTSMHLSGELMNLKLGVRMVHVPYRGVGPALTDLLAGNVDVAFSDASAWQGVQQGQYRLLAVSSLGRWADSPDTPAIGEVVEGYDVTNWYGVGAPPRTPEPVCQRLYEELAKVLAMPEVVSSLKAQGYAPAALAPEPFRAFLKAELESWTTVVRAANISTG